MKRFTGFRNGLECRVCGPLLRFKKPMKNSSRHSGKAIGAPVRNYLQKKLFAFCDRNRELYVLVK
jgi:hypothetical protein